MVYRGHVEDGVIRLEGSATLPDGAEVCVVVVEREQPSQPEGPGVSLYDRLKPLIGVIKGLPPDASVNVDHYLYGHPKK
jgi:hypothetical protein